MTPDEFVDRWGETVNLVPDLRRRCVRELNEMLAAGGVSTVFLIVDGRDGKALGIFDTEKSAKAAVEKAEWMIHPVIHVVELNQFPIWRRHWISYRGGHWEDVQET